MATNIEAMTGGTPVRSVPGPRQFQALFNVITATVLLTEASIAAQVASQVTVTIPGAAVGDFVFVSVGGDLTGLLVQGFVSAADTVKIKVFNVEGTDAVTTLSAGINANVLILQPKNFGQN